ncbi:hypothetical protein EBT25_06630, partial [bacterium]|nr:hypothetical protein [bacterium]
QLNDASWNATSNATISANAGTAPNGTLTADLLYPTASGSNCYIGKAVGSVNLVPHTNSVYLKASGKIWATVYSIRGAFLAWFNLSNGTVGTTQTGVTATIQSAGSGWYRCTVTRTTDFGTGYIFIGVADANSSETITKNGTDGILAWGAQSEVGIIANDYLPTVASVNSAPRFDHTYNGTSWISRGLLVEEQRTNYTKYGNDLSTNWTDLAGTRSYNSVASPDGTVNATKVNVTASAYSGVYQFPQANAGAGTYTYSIFAKKGTKDWLWILNADGTVNTGTFFNLSNGTIGTVYTSYSATITNVGNGWYRCTLTTASGVAPNWFQFGFSDADNSYTPSSSGYSYVYGAQFELGSFATSYISNNTAGSVTRSADVCQITGGDFSGFWNGTEGSFAVEADVIGNQASNGNQVVVNTGNGTSSNRVDIMRNISNLGGDSGAYVRASNVEQAFLSTGAGVWNVNATYRASFGFKSNDFAFSSNGSSVIADTSGSIPTANQMQLGNYSFTESNLNGHIARLRYFNKRLPNATLQQLSEPDPTLNLQFALNKTLTPVAGPAPSFSRASTGTYFNASGVLTSASINTPRFDHVYSGGQWVSRGLLIEEQRTNGFLRSNEFSNAATWFTSNNLVSTDSTTSPDGTIAFKVTPTTSSSAEKNIFQLATIANSLNTHSIYVKSGTQNFIQLMFTGVDTNYANFNISSGVTGNKSAGVSSSTISDVGNGWYRISVTLTNSGASGFAIFWINSLTDGRAPSTTSTGSIYLFGAQYEIGSFPTSYIGTTTSSVTRSADVCQITGLNFSSLWNATEGSFVIEEDLLSYSIQSSDQRYFAIAGSSNYPSIIVAYDKTNSRMFLYNYPYASNINLSDISSKFKLSYGFKSSSYAASLNGGSPATLSSGIFPSTFQKMDIGYQIGDTPRSCWVQSILYYPARLTNTKLQQLST